MLFQSRVQPEQRETYAGSPVEYPGKCRATAAHKFGSVHFPQRQPIFADCLIHQYTPYCVSGLNPLTIVAQ